MPNRESEGLPLCAAACWGHAEAVLALLDAGADPDQEDSGGTAMTAPRRPIARAAPPRPREAPRRPPG
ncbi:hypothetical protein [Nonomuraea jiangxiensis]|uniref:hypothetical protein n=1 Tax=Nonomuraea jiangxiensis TaxID=633440 RepID=UPI003CCC0B95